jgi:hypothetical protein
MLRPIFGVLISACFLGCGGNVVVDHGGTGGHGGAGGHGGGGFGSVTEGPGPTVGSVGSTGTSVGQAATNSSSGSGTTCPDRVYEDGVCQVEGQMCPMDHACCGGGAICKAGAWHFVGPLCNMPCMPCGPDDSFACQLGSLCVIEQLDVGTSYHCATDPCPPDAEFCGCAAPACDGLSCESVMNHTVLCDCPNC